MALAEAEVKAVPTVANKNVTGSNMPGAIPYPAIEVNTTKPEICKHNINNSFISSDNINVQVSVW